MSSSSPSDKSPRPTNLVSICSVDDIFHRHLLPFMGYKDACRLEQTSKELKPLVDWKILCERDYSTKDPKDKSVGSGSTTSSSTQPPIAPVYNEERESFDTVETFEEWKVAYSKWNFWNQYTHGCCNKAYHMIEAIDLWKRIKTALNKMELQNVLNSLSPCLPSEDYKTLSGGKIPSSLAAFYAVHGGQELLNTRSPDYEFFAGLLGSYSCYNHYYSMRLVKMTEFADSQMLFNDPQHLRETNQCTATNERQRRKKMILVAVSPGNPRMYLYCCPTADDPEGNFTLMCTGPASHQSIQVKQPIVSRGGGILQYFRTYVEHLEAGIYKSEQIIEESISSRGITLFSDGGPTMSRCVTRGVEVRASARWFPSNPAMDESYGLNFGYSIRIQLIQPFETKQQPQEGGGGETISATTCQLVGRHWEFMDGSGNVRRVDGEGVIGKQPLFFFNATNNNATPGGGGYIDLGPHGDGRRYNNKTFVYQSQSGPVEDTAQQDTGLASVKGSFSFVPGSIENPKGPLFHVTVGNFPLTVPTPFY